MEGGRRPPFRPRFDGPQGFRGGPPPLLSIPAGPPSLFDEPAFPPRKDRRRRHDVDGFEPPARRSRWGGQEEEPPAYDEFVPGDGPVANEDLGHAGGEGGGTPLHDEPQETFEKPVEQKEFVSEEPAQEQLASAVEEPSAEQADA